MFLQKEKSLEGGMACGWGFEGDGGSEWREKDAREKNKNEKNVVILERENPL